MIPPALVFDARSGGRLLTMSDVQILKLQDITGQWTKSIVQLWAGHNNIYLDQELKSMEDIFVTNMSDGMRPKCLKTLVLTIV